MSNIVSEHCFGEFSQFKVTVPDDVGDAAVEHMAESWVVNGELTAETTALVAELFAWCRTKLEAGSRPIPIQRALEIASEAMADPKGVGITAVTTPDTAERGE